MTAVVPLPSLRSAAFPLQPLHLSAWTLDLDGWQGSPAFPREGMKKSGEYDGFPMRLQPTSGFMVCRDRTGTGELKGPR